MTLDQAIYVVLSAAQIDVTDNNINAFKNYFSNSKWCNAVIKSSLSYMGLTTNPSVQEAIQVLQSNNIGVDNPPLI